MTLINDVLDLTKIEAKKLELAPEAVKLSKFLEDIIAICQIGADLKTIDLGLNISQRIIQAMGSKIEVQSIPGQGSIFFFDLKQLLELAQQGRIKRLIELAQRTEEAEPRYTIFSQHIIKLAKQFETEAIETLLTNSLHP